MAKRDQAKCVASNFESPLASPQRIASELELVFVDGHRGDTALHHHTIHPLPPPPRPAHFDVVAGLLRPLTQVLGGGGLGEDEAEAGGGGGVSRLVGFAKLASIAY